MRRRTRSPRLLVLFLSHDKSAPFFTLTLLYPRYGHGTEVSFGGFFPNYTLDHVAVRRLFRRCSRSALSRAIPLPLTTFRACPAHLLSAFPLTGPPLLLHCYRHGTHLKSVTRCAAPLLSVSDALLAIHSALSESAHITPSPHITPLSSHPATRPATFCHSPPPQANAFDLLLCPRSDAPAPPGSLKDRIFLWTRPKESYESSWISGPRPPSLSFGFAR